MWSKSIAVLNPYEATRRALTRERDSKSRRPDFVQALYDARARFRGHHGRA